jgi:hypothetical protein
LRITGGRDGQNAGFGAPVTGAGRAGVEATAVVPALELVSRPAAWPGMPSRSSTVPIAEPASSPAAPTWSRVMVPTPGRLIGIPPSCDASSCWPLIEATYAVPVPSLEVCREAERKGGGGGAAHAQRELKGGRVPAEPWWSRDDSSVLLVRAVSRHTLDRFSYTVHIIKTLDS